MTRGQFLAALAKTPRTWRVTALGTIRTRDDGPIVPAHSSCPLEAVANKNGISSSAKSLDMSSEEAWAIVYAADANGFYDMQMRDDLLKACGL